MTIASLPTAINTPDKCVNNMLKYAAIENKQDLIDSLVSGLMGKKFKQLKYGYAFVKKVISGLQPTTQYAQTTNPKVVTEVTMLNTTIQTTKTSIYSEVIVIEACAEAMRVSDLCDMFKSQYKSDKGQTKTAADESLELIQTEMGDVETLLTNYA